MAIAQFKWTIVDDVIIGVTGAGDMPDDGWKAFVAEMLAKPVTKYLQYAVGATQLSSLQRKLGIEAVAEKKMTVVMVTDSSVVRGIVTAASWFGLKVSSWRPAQMIEAIKDLGVPPAREAAVMKAATKLAEQIDG
jgi:hypothetical protein